MLRLLLPLLCATLLSGCKLAVMVVEGGEVHSTASGTCRINVNGDGNICLYEVTDTNYSETFTAVPDPGWEFVSWYSGKKFVCGDKAGPTCTVSNVGTAGNPSVEAVVASDSTFFVMPIFVRQTGPGTGLAITDTVIADGKEWAQVDIFSNLTWHDIDAVCPAAECIAGGVLDGWDMTGWRWASAYEVRNLFNSYGISPPLSFEPYAESDSAWAAAFFSAGWRANYINDDAGSDMIIGWSSTTDNSSCGPSYWSCAPYLVRNLFVGSGNVDQVEAFSGGDASFLINNSPVYSAGWFYRFP